MRLTGQDTRRGTFSQRHAVLVDYATGDEYVPLAHLATAAPIGRRLEPAALGRFTVRDSLLSEYAALGFEYGYSVEAPDALVAWEAQFGDFVNGAQIIIDNFLVAAEDKWGQHAGLVLLLPHGYEGQGPEHSSARIERFLSLCARGNLRVAVPSTAAQYFHLLRSQALTTPQRPLDRVHAQVACSGPTRRARRSTDLADGLVRRGDRRRRASRTPRPSAGSCCAAARSPTRPMAQRRPSWPSRRRAAAAERRAWSGSSSSTRGRTSRSPRCSSRYAEADRGGVAARGAREHGRLVVRPRPAAPPVCRDRYGSAT